MENPTWNESRQEAKEKISVIYKALENPLCSNTGWINIFCKNHQMRVHKKPNDGTLSDPERLAIALKLVRANTKLEIIKECPPVPLDHEEIDSLLSANDEKLFLDRVSAVFNNFHSLASSFYPATESSTKFWIQEWTTNLDFIRLEKIYNELSRISESENGIIEKIIEESIANITSQIEKYNNQAFSYLTKAWVRIITIWLANEKLYDPMQGNITIKIAEFFYELEDNKLWNRKLGEEFLATYDLILFTTMVKINQQHMTFLMFERPDEDSEEIDALRKYFLLVDFWFYSSRLRKKNKISIKEFHNDILNREWEDQLPDLYIDWYKERRKIREEDMDIDEYEQVFTLNKRKDKFVYIMFHWAFDAASKARMMRYESQIQMKKEIHNSIRNLFDILSQSIYLIVHIKRDNLIEDALNHLVSAGSDLKKPLKVKFRDEPGVDEGGVQKEFFQLLVRELFDVEYGMFDYNHDSNFYWIKKDTFESPLKFELIGIIIGLAIYNSNILDIHFPLAMYKKLLGREITLEDFGQYDPQVAKSLKSILDYENEDFAEVMGLTFTIEYESWGEKTSQELKEGGKDIQVTLQNKEEYVELYVNWLMNKSIEKWFTSFKKGFDKWCHGEVLQMLEPEDLEMLVCGSTKLDFDELEKITVYQDGYTKESTTIKRFWEVIKEFTDEEKRKFLAFCTGCDRAPINGLGSIKFYISKHGDNDLFLPSVHTCFNHLLIPDYSSKEILREKLIKAINNSEGFGLL